MGPKHNILERCAIFDTLTYKTYKAVLKHLKKKNKNMYRHLTKAGQYFQDADVYMADFMDNKLMPDTYDYTKLFGPCKGKERAAN